MDMDCYSRRNFEELYVPNYQETYQQSNDMSGGWSLNSTESTEKCFNYSNSLYSASSLDDFEGIQQMDDIFLNSILEDVPGNDTSTSNNSFGSSSMYDVTDVPMFHCHDMSSKGGQVPFSISDMSEENMLDSSYEDELSSEELVLQDLQRASQKLTDETRKCFRDTFYRLARNTVEKSDSVSANSEEFHMQQSRYDYGDAISRMSKEEEMELETNSIDRAIANLTFNKMESNISNFPLSERVQ